MQRCNALQQIKQLIMLYIDQLVTEKKFAIHDYLEHSEVEIVRLNISTLKL